MSNCTRMAAWNLGTTSRMVERNVVWRRASLRNVDVRALVAVAAGAAIGGVLRFAVVQAVVARLGGSQAFLATALINVTGSFAIGIVLELAGDRGALGRLERLFLATGVLGGYTTFSTFSYEAFALAGQGRFVVAAAYVLGSVVLGIAGVIAGIAATRAF